MTKTRILPLFGEGGGGGQGIQGPAGPQGIQGTDGAATMQGYQGLQGISGTDGVGIQGLQGFAGIDGSNGLQGLQGYEGISVQGIQGAAGADAVGIQGIQGAAGSEPTKIELMTLPMEALVEFYQATLAGTMRDFSQYTANGYTIINAYQFNPGWTVNVPDTLGGGTYTTDGTEVALLLNHTFYAVGVRDHEDSKYISEWITLFSPTIVATYGEPLNLGYELGNGTGIQGIQGIQGAAGGGSSSNAWYGTQAQFDALQHPDPDTDYFISDKIEFDEITGVPAFATQSDIDTAKDEVLSEVHEDFEHLHGEYMSMQQFQAITPKENYNYFIEGSTIEMVVTFTDETTATYNVVVD